MTTVTAPQRETWRPRGAWSTIKRGLSLSPELRKGLGGTLVIALVATAGRIVVPIAIQQILDRGFDVYADRFGGASGDAQFLNTVQKRGEDTIEEAVGWLRGVATSMRSRVASTPVRSRGCRVWTGPPSRRSSTAG